MKKLIAVVMTLCMMCAACAAMADIVPPDFSSMPDVVMEDDETTVDEAAFFGEWKLNVAFLDNTYLTEQELAELGFNFMPITIEEGVLKQDFQGENGEFVTVEYGYTFNAGQLQGNEDAGMSFVVELLEDGNIVMSIFLPNGEEEAPKCLSVFMVHPEA